MRGGWLRRLLRRLLRLGRPSGPAEAPRPERLVVGLGNPGPEYAETRHNAGFMVAEALARRAGLAFEPGAGPFVLALGTWGGRPFGVAKPAGLYMNQSGRAVHDLLARYDLGPADVLVVHDDLALPLGALRLRAKGSAGGHNGVQDVIEAVSSANFPRLRIGVGDSFPRGRQVEYVLSPFAEEERPVIEEALERAAEAALAFVAEGLEAAMNRYNRRGG